MSLKNFFLFLFLFLLFCHEARGEKSEEESVSIVWGIPTQVGTISVPERGTFTITSSPQLDVIIAVGGKVIATAKEPGFFSFRIILVIPPVVFSEPEITAHKATLKWDANPEVALWEISRKTEGSLEEWTTIGFSIAPFFTDFSVKEGNIYQYQIIGRKDGKKMAEGTILIKIPLSEGGGIFWYPNPTRNGQVNFKNLPKICNIKVFNIAGELVMEETVQGPEWTWRSNVASGIYIVLVRDEGGNIKKVEKLGVIK